MCGPGVDQPQVCAGTQMPLRWRMRIRTVVGQCEPDRVLTCGVPPIPPRPFPEIIRTRPGQKFALGRHEIRLVATLSPVTKPYGMSCSALARLLGIHSYVGRKF